MNSKKIFFNDKNEDVYIEIVDCEDSETLRPAIIICPGGGYFCVGTSEGKPVAEKYAKEGFATFILSYSVMENAQMDLECPNDFPPLKDLDYAVNYIFENAEALNIIPEEISIAAFSAGAHMALRYCLNNAKIASSDLKRDNHEGEPQSSNATPHGSDITLKSLILVYPFLDLRYKVDKLKVDPDRSAEALFKLVSKRMFGNFPPTEEQFEMFSNIDLLRTLDVDAIHKLPPTFIYHAKNDRMVPIQSTYDLISLLDDKNAGYTAYICDDGEHANPFYDPSWFSEAISWYNSL